MIEARRNILPGVILILLGAYFLLVNVLNLGGWAFLVALGVAFLASYFWTARYGFLVAAAILTAIGVFAGLTETGVVIENDGAWFFVILGIGFLAIYPLGRRWDHLWPVVVGLIMVASGLLMLYAAVLPVNWQQWLALAQWWPALLVLLGLWLLVRQYLPTGVRKAGGAIFALLVFGSVALLAVSAGIVAAGGSSFNLGTGWGTEYTDQVERELEAPPEGQVVVTADIGRVTVHPTNTSVVRVVATKHTLAPSAEQGQRNLDGVSIEMDRLGSEIQISARTSEGEDRRTLFWFSRGTWVDYEIWMPPSLGLRTVTSTGDTSIEGIKGGVEARTSTGRLTLGDIAGPLKLETSTGDLDVSALLTHDSSLHSSTGNVKLVVAPESAFDLEAHSSTGNIRVSLPLEGQEQSERRLSGQYNGGGARLQVQTSTGNVSISLGS